MRLATRMCLALGAVGRAVFRFEEPIDLLSATHDDGYFDDEIERGRQFLQALLPLAGQRVLEIGCGFGGMLVALGEAGAEATGVDVDERRAGYAKARGLHVFVADAERLPFEDESFDLVVSDSVIEHISNVAAALEEAARVLKRRIPRLVGQLMAHVQRTAPGQGPWHPMDSPVIQRSHDS